MPAQKTRVWSILVWLFMLTAILPVIGNREPQHAGHRARTEFECQRSPPVLTLPVLEFPAHLLFLWRGKPGILPD